METQNNLGFDFLVDETGIQTQGEPNSSQDNENQLDVIKKLFDGNKDGDTGDFSVEPTDDGFDINEYKVEATPNEVTIGDAKLPDPEFIVFEDQAIAELERINQMYDDNGEEWIETEEGKAYKEYGDKLLARLQSEEGFLKSGKQYKEWLEKKNSQAGDNDNEESEENESGEGKKQKASGKKIATGLFGEIDIDAKEIDSFEDVVKSFGIDTTKKGWQKTFFDSVKTHRENAKKFSEVEEQLSNLVEGLEAMPLDLRKVIKAYADGEDYRLVMNTLGSVKIDFSKNFNDNNIKDIIGYFFPEEMKELNDDDFTAGGLQAKGMKLLVSAAKAKYDDYIQKLKNIEELASNKNDAMKLAFDSSAKASLEKFKSNYPSIVPSSLKKVESVLKSGRIIDLFFNEKGLPREEAFERLYFVLFGKNDVTAMKSALDSLKGSRIIEKKVVAGKTPQRQNPGKEPAAASTKSFNTVKNYEGLASGRSIYD